MSGKRKPEIGMGPIKITERKRERDTDKQTDRVKQREKREEERKKLIKRTKMTPTN